MPSTHHSRLTLRKEAKQCPTRRLHALFKAAAKASEEGRVRGRAVRRQFSGGDARPLRGERATPVYAVTGEDAIDADLASTPGGQEYPVVAPSRCEDVARTRVGFLGGTYDEAAYDEAAPDDRSDAPRCTCDDVAPVWKSTGLGLDLEREASRLAAAVQHKRAKSASHTGPARGIDTGAYRNDGGCDVLLTSDAPRGCDAMLTEDDPRRARRLVRVRSRSARRCAP